MPLTTDSWRSWAENREVEEWLVGVSGVLENGWNEQYVCSSRGRVIVDVCGRSASTRAPKTYEFPTGFNTAFYQEKFIPGELYFNPSAPGVRSISFVIFQTPLSRH